MKHQLPLLLLLGVLAPCLLGAAFPKDCVFIPGKSVCGVSIAAQRVAFLKTLGTPDGQIEMGADIHGYFYGQRLLLIFRGEALWKIDAWETNPNIDSWYLVSNNRGRDSLRLVFENWSPWGRTRKEIERHEHEFPLDDADGEVENRKAPGASMDIYYSPCYRVGQSQCNYNNYEAFVVQHIVITIVTAKQAQPSDPTGRPIQVSPGSSGH